MQDVGEHIAEIEGLREEMDQMQRELTTSQADQARSQAVQAELQAENARGQAVQAELRAENAQLREQVWRHGPQCYSSYDDECGSVRPQTTVFHCC